jgi:NAD(P)H-hydrate repair Nnr-like enzyme with NAD(P)H-hydrate dehydratase domain
VAVIGGSEDYTGAPYFSAMASAKLGCDMVRNSTKKPPQVALDITVLIVSSPT